VSVWDKVYVHISTILRITTGKYSARFHLPSSSSLIIPSFPPDFTYSTLSIDLYSQLICFLDFGIGNSGRHRTRVYSVVWICDYSRTILECAYQRNAYCPFALRADRYYTLGTIGS